MIEFARSFMSAYPEPIDELIFFLKQLPGIGRRNAERLALTMLEWDHSRLHDLGTLLTAMHQKISPCPTCGSWAEAGKQCAICADVRRDGSQLCVVENLTQLAAVEKGGNYRGRYLVLGGKLSPLDGQNGNNLKLELLKQQAANGEVKEVILALSSDVEGRATAAFLADFLRELPVTITRPALGLPAGANLSFADGATIAAAFSGRSEV